MRLLISGYRYFSDYNITEREMKRILHSRTGETHIVIHGNCQGADLTADKVAENNGWERLAFPADWNKHGKASGPIRNEHMIVEGIPDYAIIFLSPQSRGTLDMKNRLDKHKIKYTLVHV
jgi:hypothetical protein